MMLKRAMNLYSIHLCNTRIFQSSQCLLGKPEPYASAQSFRHQEQVENYDKASFVRRRAVYLYNPSAKSKYLSSEFEKPLIRNRDGVFKMEKNRWSGRKTFWWSLRNTENGIECLLNAVLSCRRNTTFNKLWPISPLHRLFELCEISSYVFEKSLVARIMWVERGSYEKSYQKRFTKYCYIL